MLLLVSLFALFNVATDPKIQYNTKYKNFYDRLIANGKHTTQAQIAVMRKIIITAHSLYKNDRKYDVNFGKSETTHME